MQKNIYKDKAFLNLFDGLTIDSETLDYFKNAEVLGINVYRKSRTVQILLQSQRIIPAPAVEKLEEYISDFFRIDTIKAKVKFILDTPFEEAISEYWDSIVYMVNREIALSRGILFGSDYSLSGRNLKIKLKTAGAEVLNTRGCGSLIEKIIEDAFCQQIKVRFEDPAFDTGVKNEYIKFKEVEETKVIRSVEPVIPVDGGNKKGNSNGRQQQTHSKDSGADIILGKCFDDSIMKVIEINQDSGKVAICGDIICVEFKKIRGERYLCVFDVTDYFSTVTVKFFVKKDKVDYYRENIVESIRVKVKGDAQYDKFSRELVILASDIVKTQKSIKSDLAEEKRVELHLHTQMSSMDAVSDVKDLIKRAAEWGHKAIAITDHGVVQAYPEASSAAKKNKIKVIYGMECYLVDTGLPIVDNPCDYPLDREFIVLDIETTGLNANRDKITEIGAAKICNGQIVDVFSRFVNPEIPVPENIVELTGITDSMVKDAPIIDFVLPEFMEFAGDLPLVAHNADFDMSFIRYNANRLGIKINNTVIDTLELSRKLLPRLKSHKLNIVAKNLGVVMDNHHRAVDDSRTAAQIFAKCVELLKNKGIDNVNDINRVFGKKVDYKDSVSYHAVLLVKNYTGLRNLYKIVSDSHLKYFYKKPRVPRKLLIAHREGIIVGSGCEAGELYTAILNGRSDKEIERIAKFYDYLEIQPLGNNQFLIDNGRVKSWDELIEINKRIVELGEKYGRPVVATCDVHFMDEKDEVFRRILMAGQGFADADNQAPLYFRTTDEMLNEFDYLGSDKAYEVVVRNTNKIADLVEDITPIPDGTYPPEIEGAEEEIKTLALGKAVEIYGDPLPVIVKERLDKELNSIIKNGFSVMYIIAQKLVSKSLEDGYLVGSRGSVGSSFVANMVGITEVNSLPPHYICESCKYSEFITDGRVGCGFDLPDRTCPSCGRELKKDGYDIPFETFLGFDGDKEPDIDLNFSGEYQPVAHKYTEELFGKGHVYRAGTIATIADKTAYGFVKNYLDDRGIVVNNAEINRLVKGCTGIKRTTGQHPGGVMIVPKGRNIYEFCPIQHPADDTESSIITTHFDYHSISGRLLKLDILGHDDPTVIRMLEDLTGIDARSISIGEKRTMGIFSSTEPLGVKPEDINSEVGTFGIPEFGTKFVRQMLIDTRPTTFAELIRISGLSHGTDVWINNAQTLVQSNTVSLSEVICTRDDIMNYLILKGLPSITAFKIMEDVRKGKGLEEEYKNLMRENGVPEWYIQSCEKIKYMFPKAHAAAYVMMAFRIAWFKVYYPEAFYVTYFTVRADEFDADLMTQGQDAIKNEIRELEQKGNDMTQKEKNVLTILEVGNEMYARGIRFLPVDLYKSDPTRFQIESEGIRPPLNSLQGLGTAAAQSIVDARKSGKFTSIDDLRIKSKVSKTVIEILQNHGCLEGMPESNQISLF
jgi:DNA polymerase-3 subunit alpha (Gram-positive type)